MYTLHNKYFNSRYLGAGSSLTDLHMAFRCGITTLSRLIRRVCQAIWNLKDICMPLPTNDQWVEIADGFEKNANFPNCIGAIDGKHIRIIKPVDSGSLYYNFKHFFLQVYWQYVIQIIDFYSLILAHMVKVQIRQFLKILIFGNDFKIKL